MEKMVASGAVWQSRQRAEEVVNEASSMWLIHTFCSSSIAGQADATCKLFIDFRRFISSFLFEPLRYLFVRPLLVLVPLGFHLV